MGGGGQGASQSPYEALSRYNHATRTTGITNDMWNGRMQAKWSGYAYNITTESVTSARMGTAFHTSGLTFADANLGAYTNQIISYSKAEQLFLGYEASRGTPDWDKTNTLVSAAMTANGVKSELINFAQELAILERRQLGMLKLQIE